MRVRLVKGTGTGEIESLKRMLTASTINIDKKFDPKGAMPSSLTPMGAIYLSLEGQIDKAAERDRMQKELDNIEHQLSRVNQKLKNRNFLEKAPAEVIERERIKLAELSEKKEKIEYNITFLT